MAGDGGEPRALLLRILALALLCSAVSGRKARRKAVVTTQLSEEPRAYMYENFLTPEEAGHRAREIGGGGDM
jgi:hypothetical protein